MPDHFAAFSFVDRIDVFEPPLRARATFAIPRHVAAFPPCLVAEAVGQLAAWVAMAQIDFRGRPVAALATTTRFRRGALPGDTLTLAVDIEHCDDEAVAYHGHAEIAGERAIELVDCLGPMLPLAEFDDPAALRADLARLEGEGAPAGRFAGVPEPQFEAVDEEPGRRRSARLQVPVDAPLFGDHFPRRPVYPGTLLLDALAVLALPLARAALPGRAPVLREVRDVKIRAFTPPGAVLDCSAELSGHDDAGARLKLAARGADGKAVASARLLVAAGFA